MANTLRGAIEESTEAGRPLIWLDAEDYGSRVLLNGRPMPWTDTTDFVSVYGQLQNLLKPGVAPVYLGRFLAAWLAENIGVLGEMAGKRRIRFALKKLLGMEEPRALVREVVAALCETVNQPVMLVFSPNGELINWANHAANGAAAAEISEIDVDCVSVYLADFLRSFTGLAVAGVVVQLPVGSTVGPDLLELYSPVINVARHYRWAFGLQVMEPAALDDPDDLLAVVISDHPDANWRVLGEGFWTGAEDPPGEGLCFSRVPAELEPEIVLARLQAFR